MKVLVVNNDSDLVDSVIQMLEDGHEVLFLYVEGHDTPFTITFNCAQDHNWERQLNSLCETYNYAQLYRDRYREIMYPDPDELYGSLKAVMKEFGPDKVIRSREDAVV